MNSANSGLSGRAGTVLIYILSFLLVGSAVAKLAHIPQVVSQMAALGFDGDKLILIAVLELASTILFAYAKTRFFGLLMLSAYLGGAIATHVGHNQFRPQPAIVLALVWFAVWLRHSELFQNPLARRLTPQADSRPQPLQTAVLGDRV